MLVMMMMMMLKELQLCMQTPTAYCVVSCQFQLFTCPRWWERAVSTNAVSSDNIVVVVAVARAVRTHHHTRGAALSPTLCSVSCWKRGEGSIDRPVAVMKLQRSTNGAEIRRNVFIILCCWPRVDCCKCVPACWHRASWVSGSLLALSFPGRNLLKLIE